LYESFYGLARRPYDNVPDPEFTFETDSTREALDSLVFSVGREGLVSVLLGPDGCGKTMLLRRLSKAMEEKHEIAFVSGGTCSANGFLAELLYQLEGGSNGGSREDLVRKIGERFLETVNEGKRTLVMFDCVSGFFANGVAGELRKLVDLQLDDQSLAAFLVAGDLRVEQEIASSGIRDRTAVAARLQPFSLTDSVAYLDHRLLTAGGMKEIITPEAKSAIAAAAGGVPGRMNTIADLALYIGATNETKPVDLKIVDMAIARSQLDEVQRPSQEE
jgi:general secretion pathway protein A